MFEKGNKICVGRIISLETRKKISQSRTGKKYSKRTHFSLYRTRVIRRRLLTDFVRDIKSKMGCSRCPEKDVRCLDFHHRDPKTKFKGISTMCIRGFSKENILKEIEKCDILCKNCHAKESSSMIPRDPIYT